MIFEQNQSILLKNPLKALAKFLGVQEGEGSLLGLLASQAFMFGVSMSYIYACASAFFLSEYGASAMPYVYLLVPLIIVPIGSFFSKWVERFSLAKLLTYIFAVIVVFAILWRVALFLVPTLWTAFPFLLWYRAVLLIGSMAVWALAGYLLNVRQSKRLFSLISTGEVLGYTVGGLSITALTNLLGVENLLTTAVLALTALMGVMYLTFRRFGDANTKPVESKQPKPKENARAQSTKRQGTERQGIKRTWQLGLLGNRYIRLMCFFMILNVFVTFVMEFIFVSWTESQYTQPDEIARFFGSYQAIGTSILLIASLASGPIFSRYGLKLTIIIHAIVMLVGTILLMGANLLISSSTVIFWLVVALRIADDTMRVTMSRTSLRIIFQSLPPKERLSVQPFLENVIYPISIGAVGVLLIALRALGSFTSTEATYLLFVVLALWPFACIWLLGEYSEALKRNLMKRRLDPEAGDILINQESFNILRSGLHSSHVGVVLYSLDRIEESSSDQLPNLLPALIKHRSGEVRRDVLRRVEKFGLTSMIPDVQERVHYEASPAIRGVALRTLGVLNGGEMLDEITPYLQHAESELRRGAMIGLLRSGEFEGIFMVSEQLISAINSPDPEQRIFVAQVLGEGTISGLHRPLLKLLQDDMPQVRRAALLAVTKVQSPALWPAVVNCLAAPETRSAAMTALIAGGEQIIPALQPFFVQSDQGKGGETEQYTRDILIRVVRLCGRIKTKQAHSLLEQQLALPDLQAHTEVLQALSRCKYQVPSDSAIDISTKIKEEATQAAWVLATLIEATQLDQQDNISEGDMSKSDISKNEALSLFRSVMYHHYNLHRERVLLWLSFLYDPTLVQQMRAILSHSFPADLPEFVSITEKGQTNRQTTGQRGGAKRVQDNSQSAYALEVLDTLISDDLKPMLLPLLESKSLQVQNEQLRTIFPQQSLSFEHRLQQLLDSPSAQFAQGFTPWATACALLLIAQMVQAEPDAFNHVEGIQESVFSLTSAPDLLVQENALQTAHLLEPLLYEKAVGQLSSQQSGQQLDQQRSKADIRKRSLFQNVLLLKKSPLFSGITEEWLAEVVTVSANVHFTRGASIFEQGDIEENMYIIINGAVEIRESGRNIEMLGQGDAFGELAMINSAPRMVSAIAKSEVELLSLERQPFFELVSDHAEIAKQILYVLAQRLQDVQLNRQSERPQREQIRDLYDHLV